MHHDRPVPEWPDVACGRGYDRTVNRLNASDAAVLVEFYSELCLDKSCWSLYAQFVRRPERDAPYLSGRVEKDAFGLYAVCPARDLEIIFRSVFCFLFDAPVCADLAIQGEDPFRIAVFVKRDQLSLEVA